jgi:hypothetical protein
MQIKEFNTTFSPKGLPISNVRKNGTINKPYKQKPETPHNWQIKKIKRSELKVDTIVLKMWQFEAFLMLSEATKGFIQAFCGSGKTIAARAIGAYKAYEYGKTIVYCVPQNDIGKDGFSGFHNMQIPYKGGKKILSCESPNNFCSFTTSISSGKINELISLMLNKTKYNTKDGKVPSMMQIVCTHQCLTLAIKKIKKMAKKDPEIFRKFIANKVFFIDEGHHVNGEDKNKNLLGEFVHDLLDNTDTGAEIFLMTATPYRTDCSALIEPEKMKDFIVYSLDFLRHFKTLGINTVCMNFEEYSSPNHLFKTVAKNIAREIGRRHFVFVPRTGSKWRHKKEDVYKLLDEIYQAIMKKLKVDLATAKSLVLDLVTEDTQSANDKLLKKEPKNGQAHPSNYVVVVACMKCREGSDWCPADRLHNTAVEDAPPLAFQTNGRLFRQFTGKDNVKITYYVPKFVVKNKTRREFVSDRVNWMLYYMLVDDLFNPILIDVPSFTEDETTKNKHNKRSRSTLQGVFGHNYYEARKTLLERFENCNLNDQNADRILLGVIDEYLPDREKYNKKQITEIKCALKVFLLRSVSKNLREKGIDISYIRKNGFDSIVEKEDIGGNIFTSSLSVEDMASFRELSRLESWDEDTCYKRAAFMKSAAEKTLGRKILTKRVEPSSVDVDHEAIVAIIKEDKKFVKFNDSIRNLSKKKNSFSIEELASFMSTPKKEIIRMAKDYNNFLPPGWRDTLNHKSWNLIV